MITVPARTCGVCGSMDWIVSYEGPIRLGTLENISSESFIVYQCRSCSVQWLPPLIQNSKDYYMSSQYRNEVGETIDIKDYERKHDPELTFLAQLLPFENARDRSIVDIGCGGGLFLDLMKGVAKQTSGIEVNESLSRQVQAKGHRVFQSMEEFLAVSRQSQDIAVCFSVIEHISDPLQFMNQIRESLRHKGMVLCSTPNAEDFLLRFGPIEYKSFFYRKVHEWYFSGTALLRLMQRCGFEKISIAYQQTYPFSNGVHWLRDRKGTGRSDSIADAGANEFWKGYLERSGQAERLICKAFVP